MPKYETDIQPLNQHYGYANTEERKAFLQQEREVARTLLGKEATSLVNAADRLFLLNKSNTFTKIPVEHVDQELIIGQLTSNRLYVRDKNNALRQLRLEKDDNGEITLNVSKPLVVKMPKRPDYYYFKKLFSVFVKSFRTELDLYHSELEFARKPYKTLEKFGVNLSPSDAPLQPEPPEAEKPAAKQPDVMQDEHEDLLNEQEELKNEQEELKKDEIQENEIQADAKIEEQGFESKLIFEDEIEHKNKPVNAPQQQNPAAKPSQAQTAAKPSQAQTAAKPSWMHPQSQKPAKNGPLLPSQMNPQQFLAHLEAMDKHYEESPIITTMANKQCTPDLYYEAVATALESQVAHELLTKAKTINDNEERNEFLNTEKYTYTSLSVGLRSFVRQNISADLVTRYCRNPGFTDECTALLTITDQLESTGVQEYLNGVKAQNAVNKEEQLQSRQAQSGQLQQSAPQSKSSAPSKGGIS